jgi:hypothetical protein
VQSCGKGGGPGQSLLRGSADTTAVIDLRVILGSIRASIEGEGIRCRVLRRAIDDMEMLCKRPRFQTSGIIRVRPGEMAEWLKAAVC